MGKSGERPARGAGRSCRGVLAGAYFTSTKSPAALTAGVVDVPAKL